MIWGEMLFSKIYVRSDYHQLRLRWCSYNNIRSKYGDYGALVILMLVIHFVNLMHGAFRNSLEKVIVQFIDDILIYLRNIEKNGEHQRITLQILRKNNFKPYSRNISIERYKLFLWHMISKEGVVVDLTGE